MKYVNPKSVTWWSGLSLIAYGIFDSIQTKSFSPKILEGLTAIGIRSAIS